MATRKTDRLVLSPSAWLSVLMAPDSAVSVPLFGYLKVVPDWKVEAREIPEHLVYFVTNHCCEGRAARHTFRIEPGSFSWLMPGVRHELWVPHGGRPFKLYFLKLDLKDACGRSPQVRQAHVLERNRWDLRASMSNTIEALGTKQQFHLQQLRGHLAILFSRALQHRPEGTSGHSILSLSQQRKLHAYVKQEKLGRATPNDLAAVLNLSHDYFSRAFRRTFSVSPRSWLLSNRIQNSTQLLSRPGISISEVAAHLGYSDLYLFSRQFKQVMGITPSLYQRTSGL